MRSPSSFRLAASRIFKNASKRSSGSIVDNSMGPYKVVSKSRYSTSSSYKSGASNASKGNLISRRMATAMAALTAVTGYTFYNAYNTNAYAFSFSSSPETVFKGDNTWVDLKLVKVEDLSSNSKHFRFAFPNSSDASGLTVASALLTKFKPENGKVVLRPYTPISPADQKGYIDLVIKHYQDGPMTTHIFNLKVGDTLAFKGPLKKLQFDKPNEYSEIGLVGGGTGITPLYQVADHILNDSSNKTKLTLIFGNVNEKEILIKDKLDNLAKTYPDKFKVIYFVDKPTSSSWSGKVGYVTKDVLKSTLPEPSKKDIKILVCGPPGLYKAVSGPKISPSDQGELTGALAELGYSKDQVYKF